MQSSSLSSVLARLSFILPSAFGLIPALPFYAQAQELPRGGNVASGSVTITNPSAHQLNINQHSRSAIVNWQSFSVGKGATVDIVQPDKSSALLNRVTGNTTSTIAGQVRANGQVYLVNPNGIMITPTGEINTSGFVGSTLDIANEDFNAGKRNFKGKGNSAAVVNRGSITVSQGGYAALLGGEVENSGTIAVPVGKIGLGAGERATLDLTGDGFLQVEMPSKKGKGSKALVEQSGRISADGGRVEIKAAAARNAARNAINMSGVIEARTVSGRSGQIVLGGGEGVLKVSGTIKATGGKNAKGGNVQITGRKIELKNATVDASGGAGGGKVRVGGGRKGKEGIQRAETVTVDAGSVIRADATDAGKGGDVVVWSDNATTFAGRIYARGGATSGNGGEVEVSGKAWLGYTGRVDLTAANGTFGNLLLDPYNVIISNAPSSGTPGASDDSIINIGDLQAQLALGNVTVSTGSGGTQDGNITVSNALTWSSAGILTLDAARGIIINAGISIAGNGGLVLNYNSSGLSKLVFGTNGKITYAGGGAFAGQSLSINGNAYTLVYTMNQLDAIDGRNAVDGTALGVHGAGLGTNAHYALANNLDANGTTYTRAIIGDGGRENPANAFQGGFNGLGNSIENLSINASLNGVGLFGGVEGAEISHFKLDNFNYTITGNMQHIGGIIGFSRTGTSLYNVEASGSITGNTALERIGGLVGGMEHGSIANVKADVTLEGNLKVGGVVGEMLGVSSSILISQASGNITGTAELGGLAGNMAGAVVESSSSANITGNASNSVNLGGLVGQLESSGGIIDSFTTGNVTGKELIGGLVGSSRGDIYNSYATGTITGYAANSFNVGGLIGALSNGKVIVNSYATGSVSGRDRVGGLIGSLNDGSLEDSYATGTVTGALNGNDSGGLAGFIGTAGTAINSYARGDVTGHSHVGGLIGRHEGLVSYSYALGNVTATNAGGDSVVGGLVGKMEALSVVDHSYAHGHVSGRHSTGGLVGVVGSGGGNYGRIYNSYASGKVSGHERIGGLVGLNSGVITDSYATGRVEGDSTSLEIGGLVGRADAVSTTTRSFATGYVSGFEQVGGLIGRLHDNASSLTNSFAYGAVSGNNHVGGLIGYSQGAVSTSYATGAVFGTTNVGGIVGRNDAGSITNAYWDTQTSGRANAIGGGTASGGTGLTTAQLQTGGLPTGFSAGVWSGGTGGLYPYLTDLFGLGIKIVAGYDSMGSTAGNINYIKFSYNGNTNFAQTSVGANGYYYGIIPHGLLTDGSPILAESILKPGASQTTVSAGAVTNFDTIIDGKYLIRSNAGSLSDLLAEINTVTGGDTTALNNLEALQEWRVNTTSGNFSMDTSRSWSNSHWVRFFSAGDITIDSGVSIASGKIDLIAEGSFINNSGSTALVASNKWHIRADNPDDSVFGNLDSGNHAIWNTDGGQDWIDNYADLSGNRYFFGQARDLTIRSRDTSKTYGNVISVGSAYDIEGLHAGVTGAFLEDTAASIISGAFDVVSAGSGAAATVNNYGITVTQGTATAANGYTMSFASTGELTVNARPITIRADSFDRIYGSANPLLTYQITTGNLVNSDALSGAITTGATTTSNVGDYAITQGTLNNSNYAITFENGNLEVNPLAITITADSFSRMYGNSNAPLTYNITTGGLINGDALSGSITTTANDTSNVGDYAITQGSLNNSNYAITFVEGNLEVTRRTITVTADSLSRIYGNSNPALTYTVGGNGLAHSDTLSGNLATGATTTSNVGNHAITQGGVTNANNSNYDITFVAGNLGVTARAITVTANDLSRIYGNSNPALGYTVGGLGLVNGDTLSGSLATGATTTSNVGDYAVTQGGVTNANNSNYDITFVAGNLGVTARAITVTANDITRQQGETNPPLTYDVGGLGLVNGDTLSGSLATSAHTEAAAGTYGITQGSLAASSNYAVTFNAGVLTVEADVSPEPTPVPLPNVSGIIYNTVAQNALNQPLTYQEMIYSYKEGQRRWEWMPVEKDSMLRELHRDVPK